MFGSSFVMQYLVPFFCVAIISLSCFTFWLSCGCYCLVFLHGGAVGLSVIVAFLVHMKLAMSCSIIFYCFLDFKQKKYAQRKCPFNIVALFMCHIVLL